MQFGVIMFYCAKNFLLKINLIVHTPSGRYYDLLCEGNTILNLPDIPKLECVILQKRSHFVAQKN